MLFIYTQGNPSKPVCGPLQKSPELPKYIRDMLCWRGGAVRAGVMMG